MPRFSSSEYRVFDIGDVVPPEPIKVGTDEELMMLRQFLEECDDTELASLAVAILTDAKGYAKFIKNDIAVIKLMVKSMRKFSGAGIKQKEAEGR